MKYQPESEKLLRPLPKLKALAWVLTIFLVGFIVGIIFTPWQQTVSGYGKVIAYSPTERVQVISAPLDSRIDKWYVIEGQTVEKGQPIVRLGDLDPKYIERLNLQKKAIELQLEAAKKAKQIAEINVKRQFELYQKGVSSRRKYEKASYELMQYLSDIAKAKASLAQINVKIARQKQQCVKAPMKGSILRRLSGDKSVIVKSGQVLAELVPATASRAAELWLSGNDIPLVTVGDEVRLQFEGWPAIQFSGWPSVAVGTFPGKVAFIDSADNKLGQFRVIVLPPKKNAWPDPRYLRQGVKVHGWVMLKQVKLWFELWRRFNGFPPTRSEPQ